MTARLVLHPLSEFLPGKAWALAWYNRETETVHVRRPFHRIFRALARLRHELAHHDGVAHHPWWHFCIRAPHALRLPVHATRTRAEAVRFRRQGVL